MRRIELLAPARNLETGIAAVNCGADAVYIGSPKFSARASAANSLDDIEKLASYAHQYNAKVYAALNTILLDSELEDARRLITDLYNRGIDSIIIQDMGILEMDIPPVPLHASTQADNFDIERIKFLDKTGFKRIVLARELSLTQIREIRENTKCELEFFIHGALCVSLSGRCYISAAAGGRSANRGECAQPCRKGYTLTDANGAVISKSKFPLSLRDMNQSSSLRDIIDSGIDSLKIEGRLKDINYVKNITSYYRKTIDNILEQRDDIVKASSGRVTPGFTPDPYRTFNRGYTGYFIKGRTGTISSPDTPKSLGMKLGTVTETGNSWFKLDSTEKISNGDGLAFFDKERNLSGVNVNSVENDRIFPAAMNGISKGTVVYRNHDAAFEKTLSADRTVRKIGVEMELSETGEGFILSVTDEDSFSVTADIISEKEISKTDKDAAEAIKTQLAKLGGTIFSADQIRIKLNQNYFLPVAVLNDLRRRAVEKLVSARTEGYKNLRSEIKKTDIPYPCKSIDFRHNVSNSLAETFYRRHGVEHIEKSFETSDIRITGPLMTTKLCLKYENGLCPKQNSNSRRFTEPFYLVDNSVKYRVEFDCRNCMMLIFKD